jgi:hypothetical protein
MTAAQNITQLLTGFPKWQTTTITYSFITEYAPYTPLNYQEPGGPTLLSAAQIAATKQLFAHIQSFLGVQFVEVVQDNSQNQIGQIAIGMRGNIALPRVGETNADPSVPGDGGDIWLSATSFTNGAATDAFVSTMLHEIGHALSLGEPTFGQANPQSHERYTVMGPPSADWSPPTTLQLYDICMVPPAAGTLVTPHIPFIQTIRRRAFGIRRGMTP